MRCETCHSETLDEIGYGRYKCPYCGRIYERDEFSGKSVTTDPISHLLESARENLENYDFARALELSQRAIEEFPSRQEPKWLALLAENQVVYLRREDGHFSPSFISPDEKSIRSSQYYRQLNSEYKHEADSIEQKRIQAINVYREIPSYDVFISYKQNDYTGNGQSVATLESGWAERIFHQLREDDSTRNLSIFYDEESLNSSNAGWEPHIYKALRTAKCLILLGGTVEHINSRWVKNEWKRFLLYRSNDPNKKIILLLNGQNGGRIIPRTLDCSLRDSQALYSDSGTWLTDIVKRVSDACNPKPAKPKKPRKNRAKWGILAASLLVVLAGIVGVLMWHPWRSLPDNDAGITNGDTHSPDENKGGNTQSPDENQGGNTQSPDENQGGNTQSPDENQGGNTQSPDENQGGNTQSPDENQGGNTQSPDENQGGDTQSPDENQGGNTKPDEKEEVLNFEYEGFSVKVNDDKETVTVCINILSESMNIPSEIVYQSKRYKVTAIGPAVMMDNDMAQTINLPNSIQRIETGAFTNFTSLKKISIPDSVTYIGNAFGGCSELAVVNVNRLKTWCAINFDGENANPLSALESSVLYVGNKPIEGEVALSSDITRVPDYTFRNSSAEIVRLPDSVKEIGKDVFVHCTKLEEAVLSAGLEMIPEGTFFGCGNMTSITVPFVGGYLEPRKDDPSHVFGYIFGTKEYEGAFAIKQLYADFEGIGEFYDSLSSSSQIDSQGIKERFSEFQILFDEETEEFKNILGFYVPHKLREVKVLKGVIPAGAFSIFNVLIEGTFSLENKLIFENIILNDEISSIGAFSFLGCKNLKTIKIPEKTKRIEFGAFGESGLSGSLIIPDGVCYIASEAFLDCNMIEEVHFGDGVEYIGPRAFASIFRNEDDFPAMKVFFGKNISRVGAQCFSRPIEGVYISDLKAWCNVQFESFCYVQSYDGYYISDLHARSNPLIEGEHLYLNGKLLTEVVIPNGTKELVGTFMGAKDIKKVKIPDGTSIVDYSFYKCSSLTDVELPDSVTKIGIWAFHGCENLKSITIPKGVMKIDGQAFEDCSNLSSVIFKNTQGWKKNGVDYDASNAEANATALKEAVYSDIWEREED